MTSSDIAIPRRQRSTPRLEDASFEGIRGIDRSALMGLALSTWIERGETICFAGATGLGKTWLACALARYACRQGHSALYLRVPRLAEELRILHGGGSFRRWLQQLAKVDVLVLDDWGTGAIDAATRADLLEIVRRNTHCAARRLPRCFFMRVTHKGKAPPGELRQRAGHYPSPRRPGAVGQTLVLAISANVYGNCTQSPIPKSQPLAPVIHYAMGKMAMKYMARTYMDRLRLVIARPFDYTGGGAEGGLRDPQIGPTHRPGCAMGDPEQPAGRMRIQRCPERLRGLSVSARTGCGW